MRRLMLEAPRLHAPQIPVDVLTPHPAATEAYTGRTGHGKEDSRDGQAPFHCG